MTFFRAIPFSFAILWRYAIVLPLMIIAFAMFAIMAIVPFLIIGIASPFLAMLVAVAFGAAGGIVPIMVGTRVGLQAKGVKPRNTYLGLILPAMGYGFLEAFSVLIILGLSIGAYVLLTPLTADDFANVGGDDFSGVFSLLFDTSPVLTVSAFVIGVGLIFSLRASLLVPWAGASIGMDPNGRAHTPFYGFGSGYFSLLLLVIISQLGAAFVVPIVAAISVPLGLVDGVTASMAELSDLGTLSDVSGLGQEVAIFAALCLFFFLFFFSLQCAGAVLVFLRHMARVAEAESNYAKSIEADLKRQERREPDVDMMDLVRSRMPRKDE